jgi:CDP-diacylglycerol--serine O-phosphatidyltransferase
MVDRPPRILPDNGDRRREHRRRRSRRRRRRAYIRSVYFLPSLATLGNAICGFAAIYVASLSPSAGSPDRLTNLFSQNHFTVAAYLILAAMVFDALDGRLARFTRHTTDFGGQLDSLADVISFGAAPAYLVLLVIKSAYPMLWPPAARLVWAIGALYVGCGAMRLARFNVSNEHGEQHHFSFLGLPIPGAAGALASLVLMQQDLLHERADRLATACVWAMPFVVLLTALLMVSAIRYPHVVNRYLSGRRSLARLVALGLIVGLLLVVWHQYTLGLGMLLYAAYGPFAWAYARIGARPIATAAHPAAQPLPLHTGPP